MYNRLNALVDLVGAHNLDVVILTETSLPVERASKVAAKTNFDGYEVVEARGLSGGIILLWRSNFTMVTPLGFTQQEIHALIEVRNSKQKWLLSAVYASPRFNERELLWENLETIAVETKWPWLVTGDFNELLFQEEKRGGNHISLNKSLRFADMISNCALMDLGFVGPKFTWSNLGGIRNHIQERLDRVLANKNRSDLFSEAEVRHLSRNQSNHAPLLIVCKPDKGTFRERPFRCEFMWFDHPQFQDIVKLAWDIGNQELMLAIREFQTRAKRWNKEVFGNIRGNKRRILARLEGIQKGLALWPSQYLIDLDRNLREDYKGWLEKERTLWRQKSSANWLLEGERNTRIFHSTTIMNRKRNRILALKDGHEQWVYDKRDLEMIINNHFKSLYKLSLSSSSLSFNYNLGFTKPIPEEAKESLKAQVTREEV